MLQQFNYELDITALKAHPNPFALTDLQLALLLTHEIGGTVEHVLEMSNDDLKALITGEG
jgi:hypothetical protein